MMMPFPDMKYAIFPTDMEKGQVRGGLIEEKGYEPSQKGPLIYLNGGEDLSSPLSKVEAAGGKILAQKTSIGANGIMAQFTDSKDNRIAFNSKK